MRFYLTLTACIFLSHLSLASQPISFTDPALEAYLIQELCVDTTHDESYFSNDISVDLNGDGKIQVNEASQVLRLELKDHSNSYSISSLQDLNAFSNLNYLKILSINELTDLSYLNLDSLKSLWIANCENLRSIDISNSPNLTTSLRIEGLRQLDSLNIKNGTVANVFSLFYTVNIEYACVDDFEKEYEAFETFGAMLPGVHPSLSCGLVDVTASEEVEQSIKVYPNPVKEKLLIQSHKSLIQHVQVFHVNGQLIAEQDHLNHTQASMDMQQLAPGLYLIRIETTTGVTAKRFQKR